MAQAAKVIDPHEAEKKDTIIARYEELREAARIAQERADFWIAVKTSPHAEQWKKELREELARTRERWDEIKPADFRDQQSRVRAVKLILRDMEEKADDAIQAARSAAIARASFAHDNALFLSGIDLKSEEEVLDQAAQAAPSEAPADAPEGATHIAITFANNPPNEAALKAAKKAGFEESEDDALTWIAPLDKKAEKLAETLAHDGVIDGFERVNLAEDSEGEAE